MLRGDASHSMPPVGGLGGSAALRDAHLLRASHPMRDSRGAARPDLVFLVEILVDDGWARIARVHARSYRYSAFADPSLGGAAMSMNGQVKLRA